MDQGKLMLGKSYSLRKSRSILHHTHAWYKKKGKTLPEEDFKILELDLKKLDSAVLRKDRAEADTIARRVETFYASRAKKSVFEYVIELGIAIVFALVIATVVRQVWFELYEIPSGSMRPTFREQDHLTVSKTAFGINVPLQPEHVYFDPDLVQRTSVLIFSGHDIALPNTESTYFGIIPYKKQYIKRLIGKPGDSLYFYGGKIYGIDRDGNPIQELLDAPWMQPLEHIPFISFEGRVSAPNARELLFQHMGIPVGKLLASPFGKLSGQIYNGKEWVDENPSKEKSPHNAIKAYSDIFGIRNFAAARLLTKEQLDKEKGLDISRLEEGILYLELHHTPSLISPPPELPEKGSRRPITLTGFRTVIPLQQKHLDALMDAMYTTRFVVKDGRARAISTPRFNMYSAKFPNVPDGTYEFYFGKAYQVNWAGMTTLLSKDHPLYDPANIQKLYNLGIAFDKVFSPKSPPKAPFPSRYAYFRDGDLYLMGAPILKKEDPALVAFHEREQAQESKGSYIAFKDWGPPLKDGSFDKEFIKTFGVTVPDGHYLALGDNHAISADSRIFGFVPENNLQGAPSLIIWPPGDRFGAPSQKPYPTLVLPRIVIWGIMLLILAIWYTIHSYRMHRPIFKKNKNDNRR